MKFVLAALLLTTCLHAGSEPTAEELLKPRRVEENEALFERIDIFFSHRGLRPAEIMDLEDPTIHFADKALHEWAYFIQPIDGETKNIVMIGFDSSGAQVTYQTSVIVLCGCDMLINKKTRELEKHMKDLERVITDFDNKASRTM